MTAYLRLARRWELSVRIRLTVFSCCSPTEAGIIKGFSSQKKKKKSIYKTALEMLIRKILSSQAISKQVQ